MPRTTGAHRATVSRPRRWWSVSSLAGSAVALLVATALALMGAGATYARWNSSLPVPLITASSSTSVTIKAGDATVSIGGAPVINALYPGAVVRTSFTVTNTGATPLVVTAVSAVASGTSTDLATGLTIGLNSDATATPCTTLAASTWTSTIGGTATGTSSVPLALNATASFCIVASLAATSPLSAQTAAPTAFIINLSGRQT